jgi:hypothetical protein
MNVDEFCRENLDVYCERFKVGMTSIGCFRRSRQFPEECRGCDRAVKAAGVSERLKNRTFLRKTEKRRRKPMEKGVAKLFEKPETAEVVSLGQVKIDKEIKDKIEVISKETRWSFSEVVESLLEEGLRAFENFGTNK